MAQRAGFAELFSKMQKGFVQETKMGPVLTVFLRASERLATTLTRYADGEMYLSEVVYGYLFRLHTVSLRYHAPVDNKYRLYARDVTVCAFGHHYTFIKSLEGFRFRYR